MGIEFIRATSKSHQKAWQRETALASDDLFTAANAPTFVSRVLLADSLVDISRLNPDTVLLLKSEGDRIDCFLNENLVAEIEGPTAALLASEIVDQPHRYFSAVIEERHVEAKKIYVRVLE